ncbi:MAG: hypothetical protein HRU28_19480 [Rhizobiales bacterium]|nr:hypothetical protein [Hyphomicrobiales bacterium]
MENITIFPTGEFNALTFIKVIDGVNHRGVINPLDDLTDKPDEVKEAVAKYHTPEIKAAYIAHLDSLKPAKLTDAEIIAQGIESISNIIDAAYTTKGWKISEYGAKKIEAEYIIDVLDVADIDAEKCRILSAEASEKQCSVVELATAVIGKVKQYEALIAGPRQAEQAFKLAIPLATDQAAKIAAKDKIIAGFKKAISGE